MTWHDQRTAASIAACPRWAAAIEDEDLPTYRSVVRDLHCNPHRGPRRINFKDVPTQRAGVNRDTPVLKAG